MPSWVSEASWPEAWSQIFFSPIVVSGSQYIVYAGGYNVTKFYKYNIDADAWTELAAPPGVIYGAISMSPDGTKLAAHAVNGSVLFIYSIAGNSWTSSAAAPSIVGVEATNLYPTVWTDNDTIWCEARNANTTIAKCLKYVVSTDTWSQYTNSITTGVSNAQAIGITPDGTTLYFGQIAFYYRSYKYVISTDTYSVAVDLPSSYYFAAASDQNRLWHGADTATPGSETTRYIDLTDESVSAPSPANSGVTAGVRAANFPAGFYGTTEVIEHWDTAEPKNWSYITNPSPSPAFMPRVFII